MGNQGQDFITIDDSDDERDVKTVKKEATPSTSKTTKNTWSDIFSKKKDVEKPAPAKTVSRKKKEITDTVVKKEVKIGKEPAIVKKRETIEKEETEEITDTQESLGSSTFTANEIAIGTGKALVKSSEIIERRDKVFLEVFKHTKYRSRLQMRAINCILRRQCDVYVSLPTGAGKSLCYQLPSVVHGGISVVISPLIALMKDQICSLRKKGIPCETINSTLTTVERSNIMTELAKPTPRIRMLYITAEGVATDHIKKLLNGLHKRELLRYIIIDEAHCVTHWGHDFRPDYLTLGSLRDVCPGVPWVALTATANAKAQDDIVYQLKMKNVESFKAGTYRDNLFYDVCMRDHLSSAPENHLAAFIIRCLCPAKKSSNLTKSEKGKRNQNEKKFVGSGIIYCRSRNECEQMAHTLGIAGIPTMAYHAGLNKNDRNEVQDKWMSNEIPIVAATVAFGMGIDKPDVRLVVHWSPSQNLAGYYQEAGRAGRDGQRSYCRIYYSKSDKNALNFLVSGDLAKLKKKAEKKTPEGQKAELQIKAIQNGLAKMLDYCESAQCRHVAIAKFFDDTDCRPCGVNCDYCRDPKTTSRNLENYQHNEATNIGSRFTKYQGKGGGKSGEDDLYGGGKSGVGKDDDFMSTQATSSEVMDRLEASEGRRVAGLVSAEFARRRQSRGEGASSPPPKRTKVYEKPSTDIDVLHHDQKLVKNITLETRECWARHLMKNLHSNWIMGHPDGTTPKQCAEKLEWAIYSSSKSDMLYKNKLSHKLSEIKKATAKNERFEYQNSVVEQSGFVTASKLV